MYVSMFDPIPWKEVGISVIQTVILYWLVLFGLKAVGRRVFGELSPQDFIVLVLVAEACDIGLTHEDAGFWGTFFSIFTIMLMIAVVERIPPLRRFLESSPIVLLRHGRLYKKTLERYQMDESDLEQVARRYGLASYRDFECMMLEGDGSITGVLQQSKQHVSLTQAKESEAS